MSFKHHRNFDNAYSPYQFERQLAVRQLAMRQLAVARFGRYRCNNRRPAARILAWRNISLAAAEGGERLRHTRRAPGQREW